MNMSYCRWENTFNALRDCKGDLDERRRRWEDEPLSASELSAAKNLLALVMEMVSDIAEDLNTPIEEMIDRREVVLDEYFADLQAQNDDSLRTDAEED